MCSSCITALSGFGDAPASSHPVCDNYALVAAGAGVVVAAATFALSMGKLGGGKAAVAGLLAGAAVGLGAIAAKSAACGQAAVSVAVDPVTGQTVAAPAPASAGGGMGPANASLFATIAASQQAQPTATAPAGKTSGGLFSMFGSGAPATVPAASPFSRLKGISSTLASQIANASNASAAPGQIAPMYMPDQSAPPDPSSSIRVIGPSGTITGGSPAPQPPTFDVR